MYAPTQDDFSALLEIIEKLNQGTSLRSSRQSILDDLLRLLGADHLASYVWNREKGKFDDCVALNIDQRHLEKYDAYFQNHDPISPRVQLQRRATIVSRVISQKELERTEFFNDFLIVNGMHHGLDIHIFDCDENIGDLRIWRERGRPEFSRREATLLEILRPHLLNAIRRLRMLAAERTLRERWQALWENQPQPSFITDALGRELDRNSSAVDLASRLTKEQTAALPRFLREAREDQPSSEIWSEFTVTVTDTGFPQGTSRDAVRMIQLTTKRQIAAAPNDLCRMFSLTQREAEVCALILQGYSDKEISRKLSIGFPTVRTHLTHAFSKIGVASRSELIHRITMSVL